MSERIEVGTIVEGANPHCAARLPTFGVVTKITATGKYRVHELPREYCNHPSEGFDGHGSARAVRPCSIEPAAGAKSWLLTLVKDASLRRVPCLTNNTSGRFSDNAMAFDVYNLNHP
jgi:hypothetical protein